MNKPFDKKAAIKAAAVTAAVVGIVVLVTLAVIHGPGWLWMAILGAWAVAILYIIIYGIISDR